MKGNKAPFVIFCDGVVIVLGEAFNSKFDLSLENDQITTGLFKVNTPVNVDVSNVGLYGRIGYYGS